jgi:hypothetical protein
VPGEHLVQHHGQAVLVGGFGGRPGGGASQHGAGLVGSDVAWSTATRRHRQARPARQAEVHDPHVPVRRDDEVARVHIAVDDAVGVQARVGLCDPAAEGEEPGRVVRGPPQHGGGRADRNALAPFEQYPGAPGDRARAQQPGSVRSV